MKIAMLRVPTIIDATASTAPICPPIGLAYLKSIAEVHANSIQVIDAVGNFPAVQEIELRGKSYRILGQRDVEIQDLILEDTDLLLVSIMFSQDWPYAREIIRLLKEKCPAMKIVAGGEHITAVPEFSMKSAPEIDLSVLGEGEFTLDGILAHFRQHGKLPEDLSGTCVRKETGTFFRNPNRARVTELKTLPLPDWNGFPLEKYLEGEHGFGVNRGRSMPIVATRGCPYRCTFCSSPQMWTTLWKARAPEDVISEMKNYIKRYRITNFDFYDLTAIVRKDWIVRFCELMIRENLNVTWQLPSGTRSEAIDSTVAALLYSSGCRNLSYAPESGSAEVLKDIKKKIELPEMLKSMRACVKQGLSVKMNLITGFPDERKRHVWETLKFVAKAAWVGIDDASVNQFSAYPGSELFERLVREEKLVLDDHYFEQLSFYSSMTNAHSFGNYLTSRDIIRIKFIATALFYFINFARRPSRIFRTIKNAYCGIETTRLEKSLNAYLLRFRRKRLVPPNTPLQIPNC